MTLEHDLSRITLQEETLRFDGPVLGDDRLKSAGQLALARWPTFPYRICGSMEAESATIW